MQLGLLEAYSLLDEYEVAEFSRMFRDASAADQDEITELQAQVAADLSMLPDVDPPADLKVRVLARVSNAVDSEESTLAPLARIGRSHQTQFVHVQDHIRNVRATAFWRAAVFVLCAALIVSLYFQISGLRDSNRLAELALGNITTDQLDKMGPGAIDFLSDQTAIHVVLVHQQAGEGRPPKGFVCFREERREAFVHINGLNPNTTYVLKVRNTAGVMQVVREFDGVVAQGMLLKTDRFATAPDPDWRVEDSEGTSLLESRRQV
jgi:hypothetical protein